MKLPENSESFIESVHSDCRRLIDLGLLDIRTARLDSWLAQFCGPEETFFAACILDHLLFRTNQQFESSLYSLFRSGLNGMLKTQSHDLVLAESLSGLIDPKIRLIPVIRETDPPTKSGPLVLRKLQRLLKVKNSWMCWPWQAKNEIENHGVDTIIFIDDILGTGHQFKKFYEHWDFGTLPQSISLYYAPVVSHISGIEAITSSLSRVKVATAEVLEEEHGFFSDQTWHVLGQGTITAQEASSWFTRFSRSKGLHKCSAGILGTGKLALNFAFSHSTPNNSLPILWYSGNGWQPLLER